MLTRLGTTGRPRRAARAVSGILALTAACGTALAQQDLRPPQPDSLAGPPTILTILVAVVLIGLVLLAGVFPSKRGHQD